MVDNKSKMTVLVTGAGGFLGRYIVEELLKKNYRVIGLARNNYPDLISKGIELIQCDIGNSHEIDGLDLTGVDAIIHSAAIAGVWGDKDKFTKTNYEGTLNLIHLAKKFCVKYFIYTSSPSVVFGQDDILNGDEKMDYPNSYLTDYASTKARAEKFVIEQGKKKDIKTISLRPHLIWGPGDPHLVPRILEKAKIGKLKQVGSGENLVDVIYVENAAYAHIQALEKLMVNSNLSGNAYFIGQERPVNLWDFINDILVRKKIDPIESEISFTAAYRVGFVFEKFYKLLGILKPEPPMTRFVALQLAKSHYFSHQKAIEDFSYCPSISIEEGLARTFSGNV